MENESALSERQVTSSKNQSNYSARKWKKERMNLASLQADLDQAFWVRLFASDPSTFAPGNEVPIPSGYRIGPGDVSNSNFWATQ